MINARFYELRVNLGTATSRSEDIPRFIPRITFVSYSDNKPRFCGDKIATDSCLRNNSIFSGLRTTRFVKTGRKGGITSTIKLEIKLKTENYYCSYKHKTSFIVAVIPP